MNSAPVELPRNSRVVFLSLVPGLGHFYLDRFGVGAILFFGFVTALNGMFLGSTLHSLDNPELLRNGAAASLVAIWALGMWHAYRLSYGTDRVALAKQREDLVRRALIHYLRDELEEARKELRAAVDLDVDWIDPDPLFHLGVMLGRLAERAALRSSREARILRRRAQASFKACQARGGEDKWTREIAVELRRLARKASRRHVNLASSATSRALMGESTDMLPSLAQLSQSGEHISLGSVLERAEAERASQPGADDSEDPMLGDNRRYPTESAAFRKLLFGEGKPPIDVDLINPEEALPPNRPRSRRLTSRRLAKARLLERLESETELEALTDSGESDDLQAGAEAAVSKAVELSTADSGSETEAETEDPPRVEEEPTSSLPSGSETETEAEDPLRAGEELPSSLPSGSETETEAEDPLRVGEELPSSLPSGSETEADDDDEIDVVADAEAGDTSEAETQAMIRHEPEDESLPGDTQERTRRERPTA